MIVPRFWAKARLRHRGEGKQITACRWGWSDLSQADAQSLADLRVKDAFDRLVAGEKLPRTEPKVPYNGAVGMPIREEILDQRGETIMTRNSYGAHCLNTPDVFFADVDFPPPVLGRHRYVVLAALLAVASGIAYFSDSKLADSLPFILAVLLHGWVAKRFDPPAAAVWKAEMGKARERIAIFSDGHADWGLRVYQTPAGLRLLATHRPFDPTAPATGEAFRAFATDPVYQKMCLRQRCFRARVSAKPWRIGIGDHLRPRPGTWPIRSDRLPARLAWTARYDGIAMGFAACRFLESLGEPTVHPAVIPVLTWHDELCRSNTTLPLA